MITDRTDTNFCMQTPNQDFTAYHYYIEAYVGSCGTEVSEQLEFRHTNGPTCSGCFDVTSRQCSVVFELPECNAMGGQITQHPLSVADKDGNYIVLNDVATISNNEKCNWNSWDQFCEVSMTVFNKAPFNLEVGAPIHARTFADANVAWEPRDASLESNMLFNGNDVTPTCNARPVMKPLPKQVVWDDDYNVNVLQEDKTAIHISWPDICAGVAGCHYEVVYKYPGSGFRPQREITSSHQFRLLAPS